MHADKHPGHSQTWRLWLVHRFSERNLGSVKAQLDDRIGVAAVTYLLFGVTLGPGLALSLVLVFAIWIGWRWLCDELAVLARLRFLRGPGGKRLCEGRGRRPFLNLSGRTARALQRLLSPRGAANRPPAPAL